MMGIYLRINPESSKIIQGLLVSWSSSYSTGKFLCLRNSQNYVSFSTSKREYCPVLAWVFGVELVRCKKFLPTNDKQKHFTFLSDLYGNLSNAEPRVLPATLQASTAWWVRASKSCMCPILDLYMSAVVSVQLYKKCLGIHTKKDWPRFIFW